MLTNTFTPHVGGVARSVETFTNAYRQRGHRVLVVAPEFADMPQAEADVIRIPAVQNFNGSDFSVVLPVAGLLTDALDELRPDIVHAHHPYLLGMTALRVARFHRLPLVFTHHTRYEEYTHYVPGNSPTLKRFVIELATRYANLCDQVFAPSESIAVLLQQRGVIRPITAVPTGIDVERFAQGKGAPFRAAMGIPQDAFVVGHLGRLAPEKNLVFLAEAVAAFLETQPRAHFLVGGKGPSEESIRAIFRRANLDSRLHFAGILELPRLADAYDAMNVFAFASESETQGIVLAEAMAAGVPVVALDAAGVQEVVRDGHNGRLLRDKTLPAFISALTWMINLPEASLQTLQYCARETAREFSVPHTTAKALACYESLRVKKFVERAEAEYQWEKLLQFIKTEWEIVKGMTEAASAALASSESPPGKNG
ncbi:glycosyltransferase [Candidatus Methylobacter favarea]|nr:glycosyltransferase [Candidatus Methylobacter favarea]